MLAAGMGAQRFDRKALDNLKQRERQMERLLRFSEGAQLPSTIMCFNLQAVCAAMLLVLVTVPQQHGRAQCRSCTDAICTCKNQQYRMRPRHTKRSVHCMSLQTSQKTKKRLVDFMLASGMVALPTLHPWCIRKELVRLTPGSAQLGRT